MKKLPPPRGGKRHRKLVWFALGAAFSIDIAALWWGLAAPSVYRTSEGPTSLGSPDAHYQKAELAPVLLSNSITFEHQFTLENDTGHPVTLREPVRGCGCAQVSLGRRHLLPGERTAFTVSLNLAKGYDGIKSVTNAVVAETGEQWRFELAAPVVSRLVVPPRVTLRPLDNVEQGGATFTEFDVQVRSRPPQQTFTTFPVQFLASSPVLELALLGHSRSAIDEEFVSENYHVRLELARSDLEHGTVSWQLGDASVTTMVDVIAPPPVTIDPRRVIVRRELDKPTTIEVRFARRDVSAHLIRYPKFMVPYGIDIKTWLVDNATLSFRIDSHKEAKPLDEIVFELKKHGRPLGELKAAVIVLDKLKPPSTGGQHEGIHQ